MGRLDHGGIGGGLGLAIQPISRLDAGSLGVDCHLPLRAVLGHASGHVVYRRGTGQSGRDAEKPAGLANFGQSRHGHL